MISAAANARTPVPGTGTRARRSRSVGKGELVGHQHRHDRQGQRRRRQSPPRRASARAAAAAARWRPDTRTSDPKVSCRLFIHRKMLIPQQRFGHCQQPAPPASRTTTTTPASARRLRRSPAFAEVPLAVFCHKVRVSGGTGVRSLLMPVRIHRHQFVAPVGPPDIVKTRHA